MTGSEEKFKNALDGKHIPVLILDNKWHKLFGKTGTTDEIKQLEKHLNELLKRQGKLTNEIKDLKKIKNGLMTDIVSNMDGFEKTETDKAFDKKLNDNKRLISEVKDKLEKHEDELMELPREIDKVNHELMVQTMALCYDKLKENTDEIEEIANWIRDIRIELKKNIIKKQDKEINNSELYAYMHDIFGPEVIELFDMRYEPTLPTKKKEEKQEEKTQ